MADEPPVPVNFDMPFPVLPFPGSAEVSCAYTTSSAGTCQPGGGNGVSVGAEGKFTIERSPTTLDGEGCPTQQLGVKGTLELQTSVSGETPVVEGSAHRGARRVHELTPSPCRPTRPRRSSAATGRCPTRSTRGTIRAGESVELAQEFYTGEKLAASYRALQVEMGFEEGRRLSAGVQRVEPQHRSRSPSATGTSCATR